MFFKNPCPSLSAFAHLSLTRMPLHCAFVIKSTCPASPAACTDVRAPNVHKCQSHWGPLGDKLLTDPLLRLTSASILLPGHFVGVNSNFLCGLLDWNRNIKVRREDSSFGHWACYLLSAIWVINFVVITHWPFYYLLCDSLQWTQVAFFCGDPQKETMSNKGLCY